MVGKNYNMKQRLILALFYVASWLPRPMLQVMGHLAGWLMWRVGSDARRVTEINLSLCYPDLTQHERDSLCRDSLIATAMTACETPKVWLGDRASLAQWVHSTHGLEIFQSLCRQSQGVLLMVPHIGNWELFNAYHAAQGQKLTALFRPPRQAAMAAIIHHLRVQFGNDMVPTTPRGIVQLFKRLEKGETVAVLPDQVPDSGLFVPFFGRPAFTDRLAHRLVQKSGAKVVLMGLLRRADGRFDLHLVPFDGLNNPDEVAAIADLNSAIEALIAKAPAQYQWEYKRFKRQPEGLSDPYLRG